MLLMVLSGCAMTPQPPAFNLYGYDSMVVLPFRNLSQDAGLAQEMEDGVLERVLALNAVTVIPSMEVNDFVTRYHYADFDGSDEQKRDMLAKQFHNDLILSGSVTSYSETISEDQPRRKKIDRKSEEYEWGYYIKRDVTITASIKVIDATSGQLLWIDKAHGNSRNYIWQPLAYSGSNEYPPRHGWEDEKQRAAVSHNPTQMDNHHRHVNKDNGQTVINVVVNNSNSQSQQAVANASAKNNNSAGYHGDLYYQTDTIFASMRYDAINRASYRLASAFMGRGGWQPGMVY